MRLFHCQNRQSNQFEVLSCGHPYPQVRDSTRCLAPTDLRGDRSALLLQLFAGLAVVRTRAFGLGFIFGHVSACFSRAVIPSSGAVVHIARRVHPHLIWTPPGAALLVLPPDFSED